MNALRLVDTDKIASISRDHGAVFVALFGSAARGDMRSGSDVDVLVRFSGPKSLFDLEDIEIELSEAIGQSVDLLTEPSLSPLIQARVHDEMKVLLDEPSR